jgi:transposase
MRKAYHTDLSDSEWARIEPYLPVPKAPGRPRVHPLREILNAIFYIVRSGCAWRPSDQQVSRSITAPVQRGSEDRPAYYRSRNGAARSPDEVADQVLSVIVEGLQL